MADYGIFSPSTARQVLADLRALKSAVFGGGAAVVPQFTQAPIYVHNVSGEEIPAYACMQATGTEVIGDRTYIQVDQPADSTGEAGGFLFNSPSPIPIDGNGIANAGPHAKALGNGSTAAAGDRWAPVASAWSIAPDTSGFLICAGDDDVATDVVRVISIGGGGGGGSVIHFRSKAGGIPAKVNQQMGSAVCDIFTPSATGALTDSNTDDTIWNMASSAYAANAAGVAYRDEAGLLIAIVEDCGG